MKDRVFHPKVRTQDLEGRNPASPFPGKEALTDDPANRIGQTDADLGLLLRGKHPEDPVDRLTGVDRMQGGQNQMSRLRGGEGNLHRFPITDLADQDHLGGLPERGPQSVRECIEITPHFPLVEGGLFMGVGVFDGVLQGDHMDRFFFVDLVQHCRKRRGLPGSRRTGYENDPVFLLGHPEEGLGKVEVHVRQGRNPRLQLSQDNGMVAPLGKDVHTEARLPGQFIRTVAGPLGQQDFR